MRAERLSVAPLAAALAMILAVSGLLATVGADARWLAALGRIIVDRGGIPRGVPFAAAPTGHWPNPLVLAELVFDGLEHAFGDRGLMLAQLFAVGVGMSVLARDALANGADSLGTGRALLLAALGSLSSLVVVRVQLFSLVLFPVLAALLRSEARNRTWRIWLVVPLLALWSNLHGAALIGFAMTVAYLSFARRRQDPRTAVAVGVTAAVALCLTPAGIHTVAYYYGVLTNQAAARGQGLWEPLFITAPLDILLLLCAMGLAAALVRARPPLWEIVVLTMLAVLTVDTARSGVWLLFFLVPSAAVGFRVHRTWDRLFRALGCVAAAALVLAVIRGPLASGGSRALISRADGLADGTPVLAEDIYGEQIALTGGRIWVSDPIDAFSPSDQVAYLDWLQGRDGGYRALVPEVRVVLVGANSAASRLMAHAPGFTLLETDGGARLYVRSDRGSLVARPPRRTSSAT